MPLGRPGRRDRDPSREVIEQPPAQSKTQLMIMGNLMGIDRQLIDIRVIFAKDSGAVAGPRKEDEE